MAVHLYRACATRRLHERRALREMARQLLRAFDAVEEAYYMVACVPVDGREADLLLLCGRGIAVVEVKEVGASPIEGHLDTRWRRTDDGGAVTAGTSLNPYRQLMATRGQLISLLAREIAHFVDEERRTRVWRHIREVNSAVVLSPTFHPDSTLIVPEHTRTYFTVLGSREFIDYAFALGSELRLLPHEIQRLIVDVLRGRKWSELDHVLRPTGRKGYFSVLGAGGSTSYVIPVPDALTIGRDPPNDLVVPGRYTHVSRFHPSIEADGDTAHLIDGSVRRGSRSLNGTFLNGRRIEPLVPTQLNQDDLLSLGRCVRTVSDVGGCDAFCMSSSREVPAPTRRAHLVPTTR